MFLKTSVKGDPNIGLYGFATEKYALFGSPPEKKAVEILRTRVTVCGMIHTDFDGIFAAGNSSGIVVPALLEHYELPQIMRHFEVLALETNFTALGNLMIVNDNGIVLSPFLKKHRAAVEKFFGLRSEITTVAGINIVGSAAIATNRGCLVHPRAREREISVLESALGVPVSVGTVSFGSRFVRSGIIANSHGFLVSRTTSGPEMGRIHEALGFLEK